MRKEKESDKTTSTEERNTYKKEQISPLRNDVKEWVEKNMQNSTNQQHKSTDLVELNRPHQRRRNKHRPIYHKTKWVTSTHLRHSRFPKDYQGTRHRQT